MAISSEVAPTFEDKNDNTQSESICGLKWGDRNYRTQVLMFPSALVHFYYCGDFLHQNYILLRLHKRELDCWGLVVRGTFMLCD